MRGLGVGDGRFVVMMHGGSFGFPQLKIELRSGAELVARLRFSERIDAGRMTTYGKVPGIPGSWSSLWRRKLQQQPQK